MIYPLLVLLCLFPVIVNLLIETTIGDRFKSSGIFILKTLASYGIYCVTVFVAEGISEPLKTYVNKTCVWDGADIPPCNEYLYTTAELLEQYDFIASLVIAFLIQIIFIAKLSNRIQITKRH